MHVFLQAMENKRKEQQLLQEEIMRINADVTRAKEKRLEEEKLANTRAMDYLKQKMVKRKQFLYLFNLSIGLAYPFTRHVLRSALMFSWQEREEEFEAEQQRIKREKEKEITRLRALQQRAKDYKAEQVS